MYYALRTRIRKELAVGFLKSNVFSSHTCCKDYMPWAGQSIGLIPLRV